MSPFISMLAAEFKRLEADVVELASDPAKLHKLEDEARFIVGIVEKLTSNPTVKAACATVLSVVNAIETAPAA